MPDPSPFTCPGGSKGYPSMGLQNQCKSKLCTTVIDSEMNHSQPMQHDARDRGKLIYSNGVSVIACCV